MASTQKTLLIIILLNMALLIFPTIGAVNSTVADLESVWGDFELFTNETDTIAGEQDTDPTSYYQRVGVGVDNAVEGVFDTIAIAGRFFTVLVQNIVPFTGFVIGPTQLIRTGNIMEAILVITMEFFRSTLIILIGLEVFLVLRNRKTGV